MIIKKTEDGEIYFNKMSHPTSNFTRVNDVELFDIVSIYNSDFITFIIETEK